MKRKLLLLGVAIFIFQMNISAQNSQKEKLAVKKIIVVKNSDKKQKETRTTEVKKSSTLKVSSPLPKEESKKNKTVFPVVVDNSKQSKNKKQSLKTKID